MSGWRDISTALDDAEVKAGDKSILLYQEWEGGPRRCFVGRFEPRGNEWRTDIYPFCIFQPSHWQPLPEPPPPDAPAEGRAAQ